jgi:NAD(P)-dependent dehydrogenase (short-subunit alcohol dehydrogenase family)
MNQVLITGSNRGIGFGLVLQYLKRGDWHVFAACRDPDQAVDLKKLSKHYSDKLTFLAIDLADEESIISNIEALGKQTDNLDVLINNASTRYASNKELFGAIQANELRYVLNVNVVAPLLLAQGCADLLRASQNGRIVNVTTGSLARMYKSFPHNYIISKAALNAITQLLAVDLEEDNIISIAMYPGWVQTEMGTMGGGNPPLTPDESAQGITQVVDGLSMEDNGKFYQWDGKEHPW